MIVIKFIDTFAQLSHSCSIIPQQSPWALLYIILQTRAQRDLKKGEESWFSNLILLNIVPIHSLTIAFLIRWWIQRILTPTFSFLLLHLLRRFFLNFAFGLLPNGMNDINVRYVRKMSEKCQKCQWVYTSVRVCTSVRCFAQLCPGVSKWAYVCACVCGMNFQNTFWRLDS